MVNGNRLSVVGALAALVLLIPLASAAASEAVTERVTTAQIVQHLQALGFDDITVDEDGDVIVGMRAYKVLVLVGSYDGRSVLIKFSISGSRATVSMMNDWNATRRFSRAYIDADGDANLESDLDLEGGVTQARVRHFLETYQPSLDSFLQRID